MLKAYALRLHRWLALITALPLIVVIVTGLILSFEPLAQRTSLEKPLTRDSLLALLDRHDPEGKATRLTLRSYEHSLDIGGVGPDGSLEIDLRTGEEKAETQDYLFSDLFSDARQLHEKLMLNAEWLVIASTIAMLVIGLFGVLMGWPRLRNTLGGWHAGSAWIILPLTVLVPLTGLALAFGITFLPATSGSREAVKIRDAVVMLGETYDLSGLTSLRQRGPRLLARIYEGDVLRNIVVTRAGISPQPTNWPRALHEGNWHALWGSTLNILASVVFIGLWGTGLVIWARRQFRPRQRQRVRGG